MRNPASVVDEIEDLMQTYDVKSIDFADLTAIVKKEWILEFCDELHRRSINVIWQLPSGTRSEALDEETLTAIRKSGCSFLTYAPESASQETLDMIKKRLKISRLTESVQNAVDVGHSVKINLIIGFPHETLIDCLKTIFFGVYCSLRFGVADVNLAIFSPYPGSELFEKLKKEKKLSLDDNYFKNLSYQAVTVTDSYCNHVSGKMLSFLRFFGFSLSYIAIYISRPKRIYNFLKNFFRKNFFASNLFEQRIYDFYIRLKLNRKKR